VTYPSYELVETGFSTEINVEPGSLSNNDLCYYTYSAQQDADFVLRSTCNTASQALCSFVDTYADSRTVTYRTNVAPCVSGSFVPETSSAEIQVEWSDQAPAPSPPTPRPTPVPTVAPTPVQTYNWNLTLAATLNNLRITSVPINTNFSVTATSEVDFSTGEGYVLIIYSDKGDYDNGGTVQAKTVCTSGTTCTVTVLHQIPSTVGYMAYVRRIGGVFGSGSNLASATTTIVATIPPVVIANNGGGRRYLSTTELSIGDTFAIVAQSAFEVGGTPFQIYIRVFSDPLGQATGQEATCFTGTSCSLVVHDIWFPTTITWSLYIGYVYQNETIVFPNSETLVTLTFGAGFELVFLANDQNASVVSTNIGTNVFLNVTSNKPLANSPYSIFIIQVSSESNTLLTVCNTQECSYSSDVFNEPSTIVVIAAIALSNSDVTNGSYVQLASAQKTINFDIPTPSLSWDVNNPSITQSGQRQITASIGTPITLSFDALYNMSSSVSSYIYLSAFSDFIFTPTVVCAYDESCHFTFTSWIPATATYRGYTASTPGEPISAIFSYEVQVIFTGSLAVELQAYTCDSSSTLLGSGDVSVPVGSCVALSPSVNYDISSSSLSLQLYGTNNINVDPVKLAECNKMQCDTFNVTSTVGTSKYYSALVVGTHANGNPFASSITSLQVNWNAPTAAPVTKVPTTSVPTVEPTFNQAQFLIYQSTSTFLNKFAGVYRQVCCDSILIVDAYIISHVVNSLVFFVVFSHPGCVCVSAFIYFGTSGCGLCYFDKLLLN
jgi:hypothetical protein